MSNEALMAALESLEEYWSTARESDEEMVERVARELARRRHPDILGPDDDTTDGGVDAAVARGCADLGGPYR